MVDEHKNEGGSSLPPALQGGVQAHPRYACEIAVDVVLPLETDLVMLRLLNLSRGGAFVASDRYLAPGTMLRMRTTLMSTPVALTARVVHYLDEDRAHIHGTVAGAGVAFERLSHTAREIIGVTVDELHAETMAREGAVDGPLPPPRAPLPVDF